MGFDSQIGIVTQGPRLGVGTRVVGNTVNDVWYGIAAVGDDHRLADNRITGSGLALWTSGDRLLVQNNTATNNSAGYVDAAPPYVTTLGNRIEGNILKQNTLGLGVYSQGSTLRDNRLANNERNFQARNAHDIDRSNTVDGKPIVYLVGGFNVVVDGNQAGVDPGYLGIVDSQEVTVRNLDMAHNGDGVLIQSSDGVEVTNVTASAVYNGVTLTDVDTGTVEDVTVTNATNGILAAGSDMTLEDANLEAEQIGVAPWGGWCEHRERHHHRGPERRSSGLWHDGLHSPGRHHEKRCHRSAGPPR